MRAFATTWYEVTGRDSGARLDGLHLANVDRPYGEMTSGCGVRISSAFVVQFPRPSQRKCRACARVAAETPAYTPDARAADLALVAREIGAEIDVRLLLEAVTGKRVVGAPALSLEAVEALGRLKAGGYR